MKLREAVTGDAGAVLKVHRAVLEERDFFITLPTEFGGTVFGVVQRIREASRQDSSLFLVVEVEGLLKGFLTVSGGGLSRMAHTGKLEIMVDRTVRGQGLGRALMMACMTWAHKTRAIEKLGLSVFTTNERAIALYQELGFQEEGRRSREFKMRDGSYRDDVLMYCFVDGR
jgi:RimJ/RimL family protein N-acetyltransferase